MNTLSKRQQEFCRMAAENHHGMLKPAATEAGIHGGAYAAVIHSLVRKGVAEGEKGEECLTASVLAAFIGHTEARKPRKMRENTKQSQVIAMLRSPEGATLRQIMDATGWQEHTTRAMLSRTIQKDLGIALISIKTTGGERVYRV